MRIELAREGRRVGEADCENATLWALKMGDTVFRQGMGQPLEARKHKEMDSCLEPAEECSSADILVLPQ